MDIIGATVSGPTLHGHAAPLARIEATDRLIGHVVYQLYGLTGEEVAHCGRKRIMKRSISN